jgi:hypothetical protein
VGRNSAFNSEEEWAMSEKEPATENPELIIIAPSDASDTNTAEQSGDANDNVGTLSIHYRDGQPVIVVTGGTALPDTVAVVSADGDPVAVYRAQTGPQARSWLDENVEEIKYEMIVKRGDAVSFGASHSMQR